MSCFVAIPAYTCTTGSDSLSICPSMRSSKSSFSWARISRLKYVALYL